MKKIIITVEGGLIQDIKNIPEGFEIEVRDYDVDGVEDKLYRDNEGDKYRKIIWKKIKNYSVAVPVL